MKLALEIPEAVSAALERTALEHSLPLNIAAAEALRDWLMENGYLQFGTDLDGDSPVEGNA